MGLTVTFPDEFEVDSDRVLWMKKYVRGERTWGSGGGVYPYAQEALTFTITSDTANPGDGVQISHNNRIVYDFDDGIEIGSDGTATVELKLSLFGQRTDHETFYVPNNVIEFSCGQDSEALHIYCTWYATVITMMGREWQEIHDHVIKLLNNISIYDSEDRQSSRGSLYRNWGKLIYEDSSLYDLLSDDDDYRDLIQTSYTSIRSNAVKNSFEDVAEVLTGETPSVYGWEDLYGGQFEAQGILSVYNKPSLEFSWTGLWWRNNEELNYLPAGTSDVTPSSTTYIYVDGTVVSDTDSDNYGYYELRQHVAGWPGGTRTKDYYPLGIITSDSDKIISITDHRASTADSMIMIPHRGQRYTMIVEFNNSVTDAVLDVLVSIYKKIKNAASWVLIKVPDKDDFVQA